MLSLVVVGAAGGPPAAVARLIRHGLALVAPHLWHQCSLWQFGFGGMSVCGLHRPSPAIWFMKSSTSPGR